MPRLTDPTQLFVKSMGKLLAVTALFPSGPDGEVLANRHMERSNDAVVAEVGGVILLADSRDRGIRV